METRLQDYRYNLGDPKTREEVLREISEDAETWEKFQGLTGEMKEALIAFCMGNRGLKITYDPFFKYMFNPSVHPGRLSEFLSLILGEEVEVVEVMPNESDRISDVDTLLIMDIIVKLKSGAFANIEIQKVGYLFQGPRCACHSSDMLMRQLARERAKAQAEKKVFNYNSMKKVYTIVLIEKSPAMYWNHPDAYLHHGRQKFDTGLEMDMLQEYFMIPLDVFREMHHNDINKLEAWLYFIGSDSPKDIYRVIEAFPGFEQLYNELLMLRYKTKELINMFDVMRDALRAADQGTVLYMIEEQQKELEENKIQLAEQHEQLAEQSEQLAQKQKEIELQKQEIERLHALLREKEEKDNG